MHDLCTFFEQIHVSYSHSTIDSQGHTKQTHFVCTYFKASHKTDPLCVYMFQSVTQNRPTLCVHVSQRHTKHNPTCPTCAYMIHILITRFNCKVKQASTLPDHVAHSDKAFHRLLQPLYALVLILVGRYSMRLYIAYSVFYVFGTFLSMQVSCLHAQIQSPSTRLWNS